MIIINNILIIPFHPGFLLVCIPKHKLALGRQLYSTVKLYKTVGEIYYYYYLKTNNAGKTQIREKLPTPKSKVTPKVKPHLAYI